MQLNFLVFPYPRVSNINLVQQKLYLIPRNPASNHITYASYINKYGTDHLKDFFCKTSRTQQKIQTIQKQQKMQRTKNNNHFVHISQKQQNFQTGVGRSIDEEPSNFIISKIDPSKYIPCTFYPGKMQKIIIFFHANAQDMSSCDTFIRAINEETGISILVMEYRGYSIYQGSPNSQNIMEDADVMVQYLINQGIATSTIIGLGRSIGGSFAFYLAAKYSLHSLTLVSPFLSLTKIAQHLYGSCGNCIVKESFNNEQIAKNTKCPILIVHGLQDTLVPYQHSLALISQCKSSAKLKLIAKMSHSKFNFRTDFITHFVSFLSEHN